MGELVKQIGRDSGFESSNQCAARLGDLDAHRVRCSPPRSAKNPASCGGRVLVDKDAETSTALTLRHAIRKVPGTRPPGIGKVPRRRFCG